MRTCDGRLTISRGAIGAMLALGLLLGAPQPSQAATLSVIGVAGNKVVAGGAEIVLRG